MKFAGTAKFAANRNLDLLIRSVIVPPVGKAVKEACGIVLAESARLVPVDTGELRASGTTSVREEGREVIGEVAYTAEHAGFVEYGTGIRGRGTYPGPLPTSGVPITGRWVYDYKSQGWIGMVSQPYLRPALDNSRRAIIAVFNRVLKSLRK